MCSSRNTPLTPQIRVYLCARKMNCIPPWTLFIGCAPSTSTDTEWCEYAIRVVPRKLDCMYRWRRSILIAQQHLTPLWPFCGLFSALPQGGELFGPRMDCVARVALGVVAREMGGRVLHRVARLAEPSGLSDSWESTEPRCTGRICAFYFFAPSGRLGPLLCPWGCLAAEEFLRQ